MLFSSFPIYQDLPHWQQQQGGGGGEDNLVTAVTALPPVGGDGVDSRSSKPGSMTERARLAKLPAPQTALKCPRCESTNTKFCYFNNYNLSQPRHFCKTCRRYWTRGGTLRNVPVGGGSRRNHKKGKANSNSNRSKSPVITTNMIQHNLPTLSQLPFCPSLLHLGNYGGGGLPFGGIQQSSSLEYIAATAEFQNCDQWRLQKVQQFPFLEPSIGGYQFDEGEGVEAPNYRFGSKPPFGSEVTQLGLVKMEEIQEVNLSRINQGNDQYLVGNAWTTDLNGFMTTAPSSTTHLL